MKKRWLVIFIMLMCTVNFSGAKLRENVTVFGFVYPAAGRLIPLQGFPGASVEMRVQIPATGFDQTFRGITDSTGRVTLGHFALDPRLSPTMVVYTVKASYLSPSNPPVQGIYYSADFVISNNARATTNGDYFIGTNIPVEAQ